MVAMAQVKAGNSSIVPKPERSIFAQALLQERLLRQYSRHQVADHCGIGVPQYERWEKGEGVPTVQQYKRLCGMFRRLVATPPKYGDGARATLQDKAVIDVQRELQREAPQQEPEKAPEPETFGAGLARIRRENKMSASELGELLGCGGTAVLHWEADRNSPAGDKVQRLYVILPELKTAVDVGAVKKPDIKRGAWSYERAEQTNAALPLPAEPAQPQLAIVKPELKSESVKPTLNTEPAPAIAEERKPAQPAAPAMRVTKPGDPVADASNRYASARLNWLRATKAMNAAMAALADARLAHEKAQREHDEAQAALDALVMDGAL